MTPFQYRQVAERLSRETGTLWSYGELRDEAWARWFDKKEAGEKYGWRLVTVTEVCYSIRGALLKWNQLDVTYYQDGSCKITPYIARHDGYAGPDELSAHCAALLAMAKGE
jgi:hypothetical protein